MSNVTTMNNVSMANFLKAPNTSKFLDDILKDKKGDFVSNMISITDSNPTLQQCNPNDLIKVALNATALNLPLNSNLGYAYIVPYNNSVKNPDGTWSSKMTPTFQIGYKGLIQLAIRTGMYEFLNAVEVREGEIQRNKFTGEFKITGDYPDKNIVGYLAFLRLKTGFSASLYMSEDQIEAHALKFSKMYQSDKKNKTSKSKWSDPDARLKMSLKTVLKGLLGTYGLLTTELVKAFDADSDSEPQDNKWQYADVITQTDPAPKVVVPQGEPTQTAPKSFSMD